MRNPVFAAVTLCLAINSPAEPPAQLQDLLGQLESAVKELKPDEKNSDRTHYLSSALTEIREMLESQDETILGQGPSERLKLLLQLNLPSEVREPARQLLLALRRMQAEKEKQKVAALTDLLQTATKRLLAASSPEEIDSTIKLLSDTRSQAHEQTRAIQQLQAKLGRLLQGAAYWQDYLSHSRGGDKEGSKGAIRSLLSTEYAEFFPRSQMLRLLNPAPEAESAAQEEPSPAKISAILQRIDSLEKLEKGIAELREFDAWSAAAEVAQQLEGILESYKALQRGTAVELQLPTQDRERHMVITMLRAELLKIGIARLLDSQFQPQETLQEYFSRVSREARERANWAKLGQISVLASAMDMENLLGLAQDREAIASFLSGLNQEKAHQLQLAVISYQMALKSGSQQIPAEEIGRRIEKIRKEDPDAYTSGLQHFFAASSVPPNTWAPSHLQRKTGLPAERLVIPPLTQQPTPPMPEAAKPEQK
jgi:hypothetical protein